MNFGEFCQMLKDLSHRSELEILYGKYLASKHAPGLTPKDLQRFILIEQGESGGVVGGRVQAWDHCRVCQGVW